MKFLKKYTKTWFNKNFKELTPPQKYSFKLINDKNNVIITAPTGSGKTLAAFLAIINNLFQLGEENKLDNSVYCIYISPLKALDNDIKKNLLIPTTEIRELAKKMNIELPELKIGIRTGDVTAQEKQRQLRDPPHILITTPESFAVLLNTPKFVTYLSTVKYLVVDEIHELANNKRGVHLSLSIERLKEIIAHDFVRIGLGATLHPVEEVAKYLVGLDENGNPKPCKVIDVSWYKPYDLKVICPVKDIVHSTADELNRNLYEVLDEIITKHRTTLIFTNTRSGTERVVYHLKERWKDKYTDMTIGAHHGSLSREIRLDIENRLKNGELKAVVCSTSLELGIDIGYIDVVVQIGSPKSVTRAVQRIGRSGHKFRDTAKGIIIVLDRDDLVECTVMLKCAKERRLDRIQIPQNCLDVLAQHLVGMSLTRKWTVDEAYSLIRSSYCYRTLSKEQFVDVLRFLAGYYTNLEDRNVYGKLWFDETTQTFGRRGKYTRVIYYLNLGTIPDEVGIDVYKLPGHIYVGEIEEPFLERLKPDDIFVLGGKLYKFRYARGMRCYIEDAPPDAVPTIPAWFSEMLPLSFDLAEEIRNFRETIREMMKTMRRSSDVKKNIISYLLKNYPVDRNGAESIYEYFYEQYHYLKVPSANQILVEYTHDIENRNYIVFHALFGRRTNDCLSRFFASRISELIEHNVLLIVSDNGFVLMLPKSLKFRVQENLSKILNAEFETNLMNMIRRTELIKRRFRHCASRSFMVLRNYKGHKIRVSRQQINAQTLLNVCEEIDENFPVIRETYREICYDVFDIEHARTIIDALQTNKFKIEEAKTVIASPFAHNLILLGESDVLFMADRKKRLLKLHEAIIRKLKV